MAEPTLEQHARTNETRPQHEETRALERYIVPPVDIYVTQEGLTLLADMPGVRKEDLDIQLQGNVLTIQGRASLTNSERNLERQEFALASFYRQFQIADTVDSGRIAAELKHGVLTLHVPKAEAVMPRRIPVQVG